MKKVQQKLGKAFSALIKICDQYNRESNKVKIDAECVPETHNSSASEVSVFSLSYETRTKRLNAGNNYQYNCLIKRFASP